MYKRCEEILSKMENEGKIKVWWVFEFPQKQELKLKLKDMLEDEVDEKYYLSDKQIERIQATTYVSGNEKNRIQVGDITNTLCARDYKDPKCVKVADFRYDEGLRVRKKPICPTIMRKVGEASPSGQPLLIKNNTKKGYLEAEEGDGIDIENIDSKTRRGRVQKESIQTINTSDNKAVVVKDTRNLKEKLCDELIENNIVNDGDVINHSYTNSEQRDTLEKYVESTDGIMPTLTTRSDVMGVAVKDEIKVIGNYSPSGHDASRVVDSNGLAPTVKENHGTVTATNFGLRIRKLTPKECWRLMGFDDEDFDKAAKVNSNSQLYKQAGNSIVVNVLEEIFKNLLGNPNENQK